MDGIEETQADEVVDSGAAPEVAPTETSTPVETAPEAAPAYEPNFKLKVMDQEHEIPEQFRSIIKDADSEKMAREIFEKAYGLDHVKPKYESLKTQYEALNKEYEPIKNDLSILSQLLEKQDLGSFFKAFGLTDEAVVKHAMEVLEYHQLPPEKKQAWEQQQAQNLKYYQTEQELTRMKSQQQQTELSNTYNELKQSVTQPHIQGIAESFNTRAGQPDAFEKAVIAHAQNVFAMSKNDLSVPQAIESFVRTFGLAPASQQGTSPVPPASGNPADRKATLPKSGSGTVSPVKPKVTSIADLRRLQRESYENGHG